MVGWVLPAVSVFFLVPAIAYTNDFLSGPFKHRSYFNGLNPRGCRDGFEGIDGFKFPEGFGSRHRHELVLTEKCR